MSESSQQWRQYSWFSELLRRLFLSSRPTTRDPAERETECEWRDPETACTTTLMQGVSIRTLALTPYCVGKVQRVQLGENASYRHGRGRTVEISRLCPQSLPLLRSRLEMTGLQYMSQVC